MFGDDNARQNGEKGVSTSAIDFDAPAFDWEGVTPPGRRPEDLVIYELTPRAFTRDASSGVEESKRGSFLGICLLYTSPSPRD